MLLASECYSPLVSGRLRVSLRRKNCLMSLLLLFVFVAGILSLVRVFVWACLVSVFLGWILGKNLRMSCELRRIASLASETMRLTTSQFVSTQFTRFAALASLVRSSNDIANRSRSSGSNSCCTEYIAAALDFASSMSR